MKNTLMVPLVFLLYFLLWTLVFSIFSMLGVSNQVEILFSGKNEIFFAGLIQYGLLFVPISLVFSFISTFLYIARHPTLFFLIIPIVIGLVILSVLIIIPFSYEGLNTNLFSEAKINILLKNTPVGLPSSSIIHKDSYYRLVWFSENENSLTAKPLVVVNSESRQVYPVLSVFPEVHFSPENRTFSSEGIQRTRSLHGPYSHLIDMLDPPPFIAAIMYDLKKMIEKLHEYWLLGGIKYLVNTGAFFLVIISFSSISYFTGWRLLNGLLSFVVLRVFFSFFHFLYSGWFYENISGFLSRILPSFLITPVLCILLSVLMFLIGLLTFLINKTKKTTRENSYE